ncbi:tRNA uridine(34) hydroxylase [Balamuthia mandrillaris]
MEREERYLNVAAYKFVALSLERQEQVRLLLKAWCKENNLKGTIYIAAEGFNCFLAGREEDLRRFQRAVADSLPEAEGLEYKESWAAILPFERLTVRKKKEIIALGVEDLTLPFFEEQAGDKEEVAPHLPPEEFAKWLKEGKDMLILDTRNTYETRVGTFANSITLDIETFRDFPSAMQRFIEEQNCKNNKTTPTTKEKQEIEPKAEEKGETAESKDVREKPVVMFCTGGVRCEKAGPLLQKKMGFKQVYQLDGGILKYFEKIGKRNRFCCCFSVFVSSVSTLTLLFL